MSRLVRRLQALPETIFSTMTALAIERGAVNLGQGFPDADGPRSMLDRAIDEINGGNNQYAPARGMQVLREAISRDRLASQGQQFDPATEILVTVGATEGIVATTIAFAEPGSDVIVIEPYYDAYAAAVALAGANLVPVALAESGNTWSIDEDALRAAVTDKTSLLILNTPHNPTGTVLSVADLEAIARVGVENDLLVLADEVYEKLLFDSREFVSISTLDGMDDRTIVVSSAAKCLNATGWKTGWVLARPDLLNAVAMVKQFLTFVGVSHVQPAVAYALDNEQEWMRGLADELQAKRDIVVDGLTRAGFAVKECHGSYFVIADCAPLGYDNAEEFCMGPLMDAGVVGIPVSAFASSKDASRFTSLVRFAIAKDDAVLREAMDLLVTAFGKQ